jgi:Glycosyl transferase family 2
VPNVESPKFAICAIAKNEALYIEEWIAFHFLQGVSEILIFDNESTDNMRDILAQVALHMPVTVVNWPGQDYYQMQMEAYCEGCQAFDYAGTDASRHDRLAPGPQDSRPAGDPGDHGGHRTAGESARPDGE